MENDIQFKEKETEMREKLEALVKDFKNYEAEFDKLTNICEAYELQCKTMQKTLERYEVLVKTAKELILVNDWDAMKKLFSGINI